MQLSDLAYKLDAELMLIGQNWASSDTLERDAERKATKDGSRLVFADKQNLREFLGYMHVDLRKPMRPPTIKRTP
jgi:DNA integrity scanning protein DisA with diadenylate cyclase activity